MTAPNPEPALYDRPEVTWRDAATPLSRASRRRWTACYVLLLMLLAAGIVDDTFAVKLDGDPDVPLIMFIAVPVVFGMLRRGTRRIAALDHPELDERDVDARNSAYRIAFPLLVLAVIAGLCLLAAFGLDDTTRTTRIDAQVTQTRAVFLIDPWALVGLGLWIAFWAAFLPTGTLAWREPDALEFDPAGPGLSEAIRDAVLGLALATGVAISLIADQDAAAVIFVAGLALIGALGRRASGQPAMSRQRRWRVAIGLAMLAVVVVIAMVNAGGG